jgi:hypothetical protein
VGGRRAVGAAVLMFGTGTCRNTLSALCCWKSCPAATPYPVLSLNSHADCTACCYCYHTMSIRHADCTACCLLPGGPGRWATRVYAAGRNCGATRNGQPISVSRVKKLEDALVVRGRPCAFWVEGWKDPRCCASESPCLAVAFVGVQLLVWSLPLCSVNCRGQ